MATSDSANLQQPRAWSRFSLRSLLLSFTLLGVFLGVWSSDNGRWTDAWRAAVTVLIVYGLMEQAGDWWRTTANFSPSRRTWEVIWRCGLSGLLCFFAGEKVCEQMFRSQFEELDYFYVFERIVDCSWLLGLLVAISPAATAVAPNTRRATTYSALHLLSVPTLGFFVAGEMGLLEQLVAIAIIGMEHTQPLFRNAQPLDSSQIAAANWELFQSLGVIGFALVLALWPISWFAYKCRHRGGQALLVLLWLALLGGLMVLYLQADALMWKLYLFRQPKLLVPYYWLNLLLIAAIFTTAAVSVLLREPISWASCELRPSPLAPRGSYLHERGVTLIFLGVIAAAPVCELLLEIGMSRFANFRRPWSSIFPWLANGLVTPVVLLSIACSTRIATNLLRLRQSPAASVRAQLSVHLPLLPAILLGVAVLIQVLLTVFTLYWTKAAIFSRG